MSAETFGAYNKDTLNGRVDFRDSSIFIVPHNSIADLVGVRNKPTKSNHKNAAVGKRDDGIGKKGALLTPKSKKLCIPAKHRKAASRSQVNVPIERTRCFATKSPLSCKASVKICPRCHDMAMNFLLLEGLINSQADTQRPCQLCNWSLKYLQHVNKSVRLLQESQVGLKERRTAVITNNLKANVRPCKQTLKGKGVAPVTSRSKSMCASNTKPRKVMTLKAKKSTPILRKIRRVL